MLSSISLAIERRRAAVVEVEKLAWVSGSRGVALAHARARDMTVPEERREPYRRAERIAERRYDFMDGLDLVAKEVKSWRRRWGSLL